MKKTSSEWTKSVKKALIDRDMGLEELAANLGISRYYVSMVVNERYVSPAMKKRIGDYLGIATE